MMSNVTKNLVLLLCRVFRSYHPDCDADIVDIVDAREGKPTRSPEAALPSGGGCGLPLGGSEETSG